MNELRNLPSIDELLNTPAGQRFANAFGHDLTLEASRQVLDEIRKTFPQKGEVPKQAILLERIHDLLATWISPTLRPVINATGVIIHTNLGRAPLSKAALRAMDEVASGYSSLEYDLKSGKRGSRLIHAQSLLCRLTGAEAALVVNNNAAAVLLVLSAFAKGRKAIIPRSQLVEIGGGFRVPDVMVQSGAELLEIGTTNRVHLQDYQFALESDPKPGLVMRAHRSNFQIIGFTTEPELVEICALSHQYQVPVVDDLGSGSLLDTAQFGMAHEPMIQESLAAEADLVCFSGDKLLGGPQAGIILGRADLINQLKMFPLARAVRADKLCLAALAATLLHYLKGESLREIPVWQMISAPEEVLKSRVEAWRKKLGRGELIEGQSTVGGGSLPGETLATSLLALTVSNPNRLLAALREHDPPVIGRIEADQIVFDPRTVLPDQDLAFLEAIKNTISSR